jgi:hypothetical protein
MPVNGLRLPAPWLSFISLNDVQELIRGGPQLDTPIFVH